MHPLVLWSGHRPPTWQHRSSGAELLHSYGRAAGRQVRGATASSAAPCVFREGHFSVGSGLEGWSPLKLARMWSSAELLLVGGEREMPTPSWNTAALTQELTIGSTDPACWKCKAEESFPVPTLTWGWPQREDSPHGHGAMAGFHGWIRPRAIACITLQALSGDPEGLL